MKICPKCGYERTQKDEAFISAAECPKCGVFYEKEKAYVAKKKEMAEAEELNVAEEEKRREEEKLIAEKKTRALKINNAESQKGETQIAEEKKCKYCSMMIPADAKICPNCRKDQGITSLVGCLTVFAVIILIGFISTLIMPNKTNHSSLPSGTIYAKDLYKEYKANEVAADEKYKGRVIRVYGEVDSIDKMMKYMFVTLKGQVIERYNVQCGFDDNNEKGKIAALKKGDSIVIEGKCGGLSLFAGVQLTGCKIIR